MDTGIGVPNDHSGGGQGEKGNSTIFHEDDKEDCNDCGSSHRRRRRKSLRKSG